MGTWLVPFSFLSTVPRALWGTWLVQFSFLSTVPYRALWGTWLVPFCSEHSALQSTVGHLAATQKNRTYTYTLSQWPVTVCYVYNALHYSIARNRALIRDQK